MAQITITQSVADPAGGNASLATVTIGRRLVLIVHAYRVGATPAVTAIGGTGAAWASASAVETSGTGLGVFIFIGVAKAATVTVSVTGTYDDVATTLYELSIAGGAVAVVSAGTGTGTAADSGTTGTLSSDEDLALGGAICVDSANSFTPGGGFTEDADGQIAAGNYRYGASHLEVTSTTGLAATYTLGVSAEWRAAILVITHPAGSTRLYIPSGNGGAANNASTGWGHNLSTSATGHRTLDTAKSDSALTTRTVTWDAADHLVSANACMIQGWYGPLAAQTIAVQDIAIQIRALEIHANNNLFMAAKVYIVQSDLSTVRGTILAVTRETTSEFPASLTNRSFRDFLVELAISAGDYLVVEIGAGGVPTAATGTQGHNWQFREGDPTAGTDLAEDDTSTADDVPWIQLWQTLTLAPTDLPPGLGPALHLNPTLLAGADVMGRF